MGRQERISFVRELWDAYAADGLDGMLAFAGDDVTWEPHTAGGRVFRGSAEFRAHLASVEARGEQMQPRVRTIEAHGSCVLALGQLRTVAPGYISDSPLAWLYLFDDEDRLIAASGHTSRESALERIAAKRPGEDRAGR